ncbi:hypothetical protein 7S2_37 [uncultured Caudovirales phage]|uniref:Uncharacterized protein n=1 Tax=uncultured Caudovirales phage TaxID=2100421 RepID=A0A2H4J9V8_9CAUD|nr:hypothetical protein 7S2_37 [uncultured Caudovirales phage]
MTATQDPLVQAAMLAYHRAAANVHSAQANRIEADLKAAEDERLRKVAKAMRREAKRFAKTTAIPVTTA